MVYADPSWKLDLLHVAKRLAEVGYHMEAVLPNGCFFGTLPSEVDPEECFKSVKEIIRWKPDVP